MVTQVSVPITIATKRPPGRQDVLLSIYASKYRHSTRWCCYIINLDATAVQGRLYYPRSNSSRPSGNIPISTQYGIGNKHCNCVETSFSVPHNCLRPLSLTPASIKFLSAAVRRQTQFSVSSQDYSILIFISFAEMKLLIKLLLNPFNASCSKLLLFDGFSAILV